MYVGTTEAAEATNFWPMEGEIGWFSGYFDVYAPPTDNIILCNLMNSAPLFEYVVGGGDLFNAPEPIIEEPLLELDPITAAICMMLNGEDVIAAEAMKVVDLESIQDDHLVSEIFYGCKKGLLEKSAINESFPEQSDLKFSTVHVEEDLDIEDWSFREEQLQKSVSSECRKSIELTRDCSLEPNLDGFQEIVLEDACGTRRAYSDGDILVRFLQDSLLSTLQLRLEHPVAMIPPKGTRRHPPGSHAHRAKPQRSRVLLGSPFSSSPMKHRRALVKGPHGLFSSAAAHTVTARSLHSHPATRLFVYLGLG
ncbi:hypothetical protein KSP40_PGU008494 [Platanthera guangdongensis]|uniref:Uncharacterized protein n=1 Tax=Platanthera guangdongensis TaxID=2320717 RepID=A0ABR2LG81_9ASPA